MESAIIQNKNLESIVRKTVISVFREIFSDPECHLKLKPNFVKKLKKSLESKKMGRVYSFDSILKKYQL